MTAEQLKARRIALGLSQRQLAILLDLSQQMISQWERGARPIRWPTVLKLALDAIETRFAADGLLPERHDDATP